MDETTSKLIEICSDVGNALVNEIKQRHKAAGQYVTGKTSAMLHIQPTEGGFRLIGWKYSGTYEEGRKPNVKPWGSSGNKSTDFSQALLALPEKKNEVSGLMIMGLFGGTVFPLIMGFASDAIGQIGAVLVMAVGVLYLFSYINKVKM